MQEIIEELVIVNPQGLHARPAASLVKTALQFKSDIRISVNGQTANAKSIIGLLTLAAAQGTKLTVTCRGEDAEAAMAALRELVESGFGEM
mgnify:CR=1 FL=1